MTVEKAYEILDMISEKNCIDLDDKKALIELSANDDAEIRAYVAELLVLSNESDIEERLINMCGDQDELVRINAYDSLSNFTTIDSYSCLLKCVQSDESNLARNYALLAIIDIMNCVEISKVELKELFLTYSCDNEVFTKAICFKGLYVLGEIEYLDRIIQLLNAEEYQDRCAILNILRDIMTNENRESILSAINALNETEESEAVQSTINDILCG